MRIDREGVEIRAPEPEGVFYGTRSLLQLLPVRGGATATAGAASPAVALPFLEIADAPRFRYRGLHLDVSRHWFPVEFVKRYVDLMARYKLNVFHWHLTDDQGWRLEIRRYPRLTEVGGRRRETMVGRHFDPYVGDGVPYQGWYTQEEVRDVVAYAAERYVTVIPEIEMPGHSMAVLAAYPELACTPGPFEVATTWGVHEDILCPKEETFTFLQNVLQEVMELFPSPLLHVGGDEAPRARWIESPVAQEVIRTQGLADESELQSWFLRRIERFVGAHGRRVVGWDEILEGGLPPDAVVMSWRGVEGGVEAARQGHDVIMAPTSHVYFDYYQGDPESEPLAIGGYLPLERVYGFEPVPEDLDAAEAAHVLGAQGNVWTEYLATPEAVEYMAFPRALALAEVVWSPRGRRDLPDFLRRLRPRLAELDALGVAYRPLDGPPSPAP
jgi:hexosaminidase